MEWSNSLCRETNSNWCCQLPNSHTPLKLGTDQTTIYCVGSKGGPSEVVLLKEQSVKTMAVEPAALFLMR